MAAVGRSPYLLTICVYMFLYTVMSTFLGMEQSRIVSEAAAAEGRRVQIFATLDVWANVVTLAVQLFVAGRLIRWLGVGVVLALLPALSAAGFGALWAAPLLGLAPLAVVTVFGAARRGLQHALVSPARQVLFTVVGPDERYKSKAFIDTAVYRAGDLAGAWGARGIVAGAVRAGIAAWAAVPMVAVPVGVVGTVFGLVLGRMLRARTRVS